jgi:hypothetical protein
VGIESGAAGNTRGEPPQLVLGRFAINRVVAFGGPFVALLSGTLAAWLGRHFPGLGVDHQTVATDVASAVEFALGAFVTWALHQKWLDGYQRWELAGRAAESPPATVAVTGDVVDPPAAGVPPAEHHEPEPPLARAEPDFDPADRVIVPPPPRVAEPLIDDPFAPA